MITGLQIFSQVAKAIEQEPIDLKKNIYGVLERISLGDKIGMPLCRPLSKIFKGLYELRFSYQAGDYRVFYYIKMAGVIYVIHAMKKKKQPLDLKTIDLLRKRIGSV